MGDHHMHDGHDMHTAMDHGGVHDAHDTASDETGDDMNHHSMEHGGKIVLVYFTRHLNMPYVL